MGRGESGGEEEMATSVAMKRHLGSEGRDGLFLFASFLPSPYRPEARSRPGAMGGQAARGEEGRAELPMRWASTARAASRPSQMAQTTRL